MGSVTQLSYLLSSPGSRCTNPLNPAAPSLCRVPPADLGPVVAAQVPSLTAPGLQAKLGPGPHVLFELTVQAERPVNNLHSRSRKPHQICLEGCQMWNRCAEMEEIMSPPFPLSHVTVMTKESPRSR